MQPRNDVSDLWEAIPHLQTDRRQLLQGLGLLASTGLIGCTASNEPATRADQGSVELPDELWRAGARQLANAIKAGDVTSVEVVEAHLERIEAVNEKVNAIIELFAERALEQASRADAAVAAGDSIGPLHGVPFTIKDNLPQIGSANTNGLEENQEPILETDAIVVEKMKAAGGIPLGRTNLPDMALRVHTYSELWGRTLNPWSSRHNVGGSSGGEGAALATGMSPIGLGNDIGGSVRNPANCCAIASLKPSLGRVAQAGSGTIGSQLMAVDGPMARRVEDVRLGYEILAGHDTRDPWSAPVELDLPKPATQRVALVPEPSGGETDPSVAEGVRQAGTALAAAGYEVEEIEPPRLADVATAWTELLLVELEPAMPFFKEVMSAEAYRFLDLVYQNFQSEGLPMYMRALQQRHALLAEWREFFTQYPLVVGPVFTRPPFEIGYDVAGKEEALDVMVQLRLVVAPNILGLPAAAVPVSIGIDGLPRGVQVIGDRFRDDLCLEGAAAIEGELGTFTPIDPRA